MTLHTLVLLLPEIVLLGAGLLIYVLGAFLSAREAWSWIGVAAIALAGAALACVAGEPAAGGGVVLDPLATFGRGLALATGLLLVLFTLRGGDRPCLPETVATLLMAVAGAMLAAGAGELIHLFVALELVSIPTYVLLYLGRRDAASQEATVKYFFLSILSSAVLLYGFSFLYGTTGSTELAAIREAMLSPETSARSMVSLVRLALVLVVAGVGFRITAVPFHFYAPDVYQGTTHANAALLAVLPKVAGLVVLVRWVVVAMPAVDGDAWRLLLALSAVTMTFGNMVALWQDNLRRLMAYSSIAHAGYMLIGVAVGAASGGRAGAWDGLAAMLFYLGVYGAATLGIFAALAHLGPRERQIDSIEELAGLGRTRPLLAAAISAMLFSLAGIPPLAGFWGKLSLFGSALAIRPDVAGTDPAQVRIWFIALAVVGALNAAVAAAYYLKILAAMYFRTPLGEPAAQGGRGPWVVAIGCALVTLALGCYPNPLWAEADRASPATIWNSPAGQAESAP